MFGYGFIVGMTYAFGLFDDSHRTRLHGLKGHFSFFNIIGPTDDDNRDRTGFHNSPGGLDPVQLGHIDVHHDYIRLLFLNKAEGVGPISHHIYHFKTGFRIKDVFQIFSSYWGVFDN